MRKAFLTVLLVSVIVFVSISFMGASCTVTPGPGPTYYTITVTNQSGINLALEIYDNPSDFVSKFSVLVNPFQTNSLTADYGDYVKIWDATSGIYLNLPPSYNTYMFINSSIEFTVGSGGGWVTEGR